MWIYSRRETIWYGLGAFPKTLSIFTLKEAIYQRSAQAALRFVVAQLLGFSGGRRQQGEKRQRNTER